VFLAPRPTHWQGSVIAGSIGASEESTAAGDAQEGFRTDNVAICVEDLKLQLLAKSCFVPGLPNLLFNLIMSSSEADVRRGGYTLKGLHALA
jgi:hypothetical protein